jgi:ornithine carbamoyltransferase
VTRDPHEAVRGADVIYTDSWMSFHVPQEALDSRIKALKPFQVDAEKMALGAPDAIFMNCLPALRGFEQTAEVIDGPQSVVFDQAENRLHAQKAIMITLMKAKGTGP